MVQCILIIYIIYAENTNKNIKKNYTKYFVNWECDLKFIKKDDP